MPKKQRMRFTPEPSRTGSASALRSGRDAVEGRREEIGDEADASGDAAQRGFDMLYRHFCIPEYYIIGPAARLQKRAYRLRPSKLSDSWGSWGEVNVVGVVDDVFLGVRASGEIGLRWQKPLPANRPTHTSALPSTCRSSTTTQAPLLPRSTYSSPPPASGPSYG